MDRDEDFRAILIEVRAGVDEDWAEPGRSVALTAIDEILANPPSYFVRSSA